MNVNEYVDYINNIQKCNPYPKGGSTGTYYGELASRLNEVSSTALKLFLLIASDINEYGQTNRKRKDFNRILGFKEDRARMSKLFGELVDKKWIALFGKYITINPYMVMPRVNNPKIKAAIQEAWIDIVEFY